MQVGPGKRGNRPYGFQVYDYATYEALTRWEAASISSIIDRETS
jgi:hypothetical protein